MSSFPIIVEPPARTGLRILVDNQLLLTVDATVTERHTTTAQITQYPRENLSPGSDHIQPEQPQITTEIVVSKTPLTETGSVRRDIEAYETLRALQARRTLVTLVTSLRVYEDVALGSLSAVRSSTTGQKLLADATWQQLEVGTVEQTAIPADVIAALARSSAKPPDDTQDQVIDDNDAPARKKTAAQALRDGIVAASGGD